MSDFCINNVENHWKTLTNLANDFFNKKNYKLALNNYKNALYRAEVLNNHLQECIRLKIPFIQVYIISCNNLANTYKELEQMEEAENILKRTVHYLLHLTRNKNLNKYEIQTELKRASLNYINFTEQISNNKAKQVYLYKQIKEHFSDND